MTDKETIQKAKELARKVISLSHSCDLDKLDEVELKRLNELVVHARTMFVDPGEYNSEDDSSAFE